MVGFILAAGFGTRLRPLTDHIPKALVPLAGKPLLEHALSFLHSGSIKKVAVNTHYRAEDIERFRKEQRFDFTVFNETPEILGTGGALYNARDFLTASDSFIVVNADIIARFDLQKQIHSFLQTDEICRLIAFSPQHSNGTVFYRKTSRTYCGTAASDIIDSSVESADFIGIALYRKKILTYLTKEDFSILPVWDRAGKAGENVSVNVIENGYRKDLGTPQKFADAHFDCITGKLDLPKPDGLRFISDNVICCPSSWTTADMKRLKRMCWIECDVPPGSDNLENCIAITGAEARVMNLQSGMLHTKWGGIALNG